MSDHNYMLMEKEAYEKCRNLKQLRLMSSEKIAFIRMLAFRLFIYIDLIDNDLYDYDELLTDIRLTIEELYNYSIDYSNMLNNYSK